MELHYLKNEIGRSNKSLHLSEKLSLRKMFKHKPGVQTEIGVTESLLVLLPLYTLQNCLQYERCLIIKW